MASRARTVLSGSSKDTLPEGAAGDGYSYLPWVDLISAGVPCQDASVAGKRAGLAGARTGLFYEFARILRELRPTWFLFENVPGLLSSNHGRDFAEVLRVLMVECGYGVSWRVLDSQFFGVAQRRRRLFIVGRFGKPCPPEVLFEPEGGEGDIATGREAGQDVAVPLTSGTGVTGNSSGRHQEDDFNIVTAPIDGTWAKGGSGKSDYPVGLVASALSAPAGHHGHSSPRGDGSDNLVLGRHADDGHSRLLHAGKGADDAGEKAFCLRSDPGGTGQGHNTNYVTTALRHLGSGGADDNDAQGGFLHVSSPSDSHGVRDASELSERVDYPVLPQGLDSARYRALGNAVTVSVIKWIGRRILALETL